MLFVDIIVALAVLQFIVFGFQVGAARERYGVKAPASSGHPTFDRYYRVQQNTLEQLVALLPGLYLFSSHVSAQWAAGLGLVYLIGRQIYALTYVKDPTKRGLGFGLTFLPVAVLVVGGLVGAVWHAIH